MGDRSFDNESTRGPPADIVSSMSAARESAISSAREAAASPASVASVQSAVSVQSVESAASVEAEATDVGAAAAATKGQLSVSLDAATTLAVTGGGETATGTADGEAAAAATATTDGEATVTATDEDATAAVTTGLTSQFGNSDSTLTGSSAFESSTIDPLSGPASPTASSSAPSTLSTSIISSINSYASENAAFPTTSASPRPSTSGSDPIFAIPDSTAQREHHPGLSSGEKAAAIVFPILFVLGVLLAFLLGRRRRRRSDSPPSQFAFPSMKQRRHIGPAASNLNPVFSRASDPPPVLTSTQNDTYYTGLDTASSQSSESNSLYAPPRTSLGGIFYEPPPAYNKKTSSESGGSPPSYNLPDLDFPSTQTDAGWDNPFSDPEPLPAATVADPRRLSALTITPVALERPALSRTATNRSFTSDLYSETASLHSARAARLSVGGEAHLVPTFIPTESNTGREGAGFRNARNMNAKQSGERSARLNDPFGDPVSPVTSEFGRADGWRDGAVSPMSRGESVRRAA